MLRLIAVVKPTFVLTASSFSFDQKTEIKSDVSSHHDIRGIGLLEHSLNFNPLQPGVAYLYPL